MATHTFELRLAGFSFPAALPNDKANFRMVVDVRYETPDGEFATEHAVLPALDTFWECATDKAGEPNYVRAANSPSFDINRVDEWDSLMLRLKASRVYAINVSVFDVNRRDAWDAIKAHLGPVVETIFGRVTGSLPPGLVGQTLGAAADDVKAYVLRKLAGADNVLFRRSAALSPGAGAGPFQHVLTGRGVAGEYSVIVALRISSA